MGVEIHLPFKTVKDQLREALKNEYGAEVELGEMVGKIEHVFSHLTWNVDVYEGRLVTLKEEKADLKMVSEQEIEAFPFPVSHQKMINSFLNKEGLE